MPKLPSDALNPATFPLGSPASRATARALFDQKKKCQPDMRIIIGWGTEKPSIGRFRDETGRLIEIVHPLPRGGRWSAKQGQDFLAAEPPDKQRLWEQCFERDGDPRIEPMSDGQAPNDEA